MAEVDYHHVTILYLDVSTQTSLALAKRFLNGIMEITNGHSYLVPSSQMGKFRTFLGEENIDSCKAGTIDSCF